MKYVAFLVTFISNLHIRNLKTKQAMYCKLASLITAEQLLPIIAVVFF